MDGYVNKQLHSKKSNYIALLANGIIRRHFFEDSWGRGVIVTSARYCDMVRNSLSPALPNFPEYDDMIWF